LKVTLESTSQIVNASGIDCRVWEGETEHGVRVVALIPRLAVKNGQDTAQFEAELQETRAPSIEAQQAYPLRMIL